MKVGVFSDLHLHNFKQFSRPEPTGVNSRAQACLDVLGKILSQEDCKTFLFCGDFWHVRWSIPTTLIQPVQNILYRNLQRCETYCYAIPGNHDQPTKDPYGPNALAAIGACGLVDISGLMYYPDLFILGVPAGASLPVIDIIDKQNKKVLILHQMIEGTEISASGHITNTGSSLDSIKEYMAEYSFDKCFIGDIHKRHQLDDDIWYVGSSLQHDFGDEGQDKGMLIWDTESGEVTFREIVSPQFKTITDPEKQTIDSGNYYRIYTTESNIETTLKKFGHLWNVKVIPPRGTDSQPRMLDFKALSPDNLDKILSRYVSGICKESIEEQVELVKLGRDLFNA